MPIVTVDFHRLATREYLRAYRWYARRSPRAAQGFVNAINKAVQKIAGGPSRHPTYLQHFHWVQAHRHHYVLYYRILDPNTVLIMAVSHTSRRPGYWLRRRP